MTIITVHPKTAEQRQRFIEQAAACAERHLLAGLHATTAAEQARHATAEAAYLQLASALILQEKEGRYAVTA